MVRSRMNYYLSDGFPLVQNPAAGPYPAFPGTPIGFTSAPVCRRRVPFFRRRGRLGLGSFGASPDIIEGMVGEGYDVSVITALDAAGATDLQLQALWDNYEPGSQDFAEAASQQLFLLTSGQQGHLTKPVISSSAAPPPAAPTATHPTIQTQAPARPQATTNVPYYVPYQPQSQPTWWQQYGTLVLIGGGIFAIGIFFHRR